ncbi:MAG TPA: NAD-dependent succinate-semialdehyde dehydrogenase [Stellaceae bacterium]|nr:NAD-dependent succinate-semialdehyde dehydrogenase [Stellaceae bacterium]
MYANLALYIDGEWISGGGRESEPVINPATEKPLATLTHANKADLDRALEAAERGYKVWRATAPYERARIMRKAAEIFRERLEPIARILTMEQGKVIAEARIEVAVSADIIEWYAEEGKRSYGRIIPGRVAGVRQMTVQEPVGVCAAFTPWNFPGVTPARKIGGALGAGCSLIIKASEETPGTCVELVRAFHEAGLPKGVLNLVFGVPARISEHIIASDIVRKVSFTGSVPVGKHLTKLAAEGMKRTTMELGGHSPVIVFGDADPEKSAEIAAAGKFRNAGQVCISPTRFYVQENNYDRFVKRFADYAKGLKLGDGLTDGTTMGPLANPRRLDAMEGFVADAKKRGAEILAGGARHGNQGFFFAPTVVANIPDDSRLMTEEPFGPVAPITPFKTFDEVVARANALPFGLAAYTFTSSTRTANLISDALESGMVGVNSLAISTPETPFGGMKESGYGHEGGIEGLEAYTQKKLVVQA